jgi:Ca2+/H+ antiporter, TMEM165/GDT1 family
VSAFLVALGLVFVAELGDKSQLMTLTFATRYRPLPVLAGVAGAALFIQGISVLVGSAVAAAVPERGATIVAGLLFVGFAAWTWFGTSDADGRTEADMPVVRSRRVALTVAVTFVVSELGDKTMLATAALAARQSPLATWLGSATAMIASAALAIVVGAQLARRLTPRRVRLIASLGFLVFGLALLLDAAVG